MKCPKCSEILQSMYIRQSLPGSKGERRTFSVIGLVCPNKECDFCKKSEPEKEE